MFAVNYSTLRENMKECFDRVADGFETMIVTRKKTNMVVMSENSYNSLMETVYLLGNKENHDHLMKSLEQYRNGGTSIHEINLCFYGRMKPGLIMCIGSHRTEKP